MQTESPSINRSVLVTASIFGVMLAISGIHHGIFEYLQGSKITETFIIQSIGPSFQRWMNGEEVFSVLHNYRATGIAAIAVGTVLILWSIFFLKKAYGPAIFILLFILLTLVGGGIFYILFFIPVGIYSFKINKEIYWKGKDPSNSLVKILSDFWPFMLLLTCFLFLSALEFSLFGIEGASNERINTVIYIELLLGVVTLNVTFIGAIVRDISRQKVTR